MATAGFDSGIGRHDAAVPLDQVAADMRSIFGTGKIARHADHARVRMALEQPVQRRSRWRRAGAVLLAGGGAGALLGWWVLATTPHVPVAHAPAPARLHSAATRALPAAAALPDAGAMTQPVAAETPDADGDGWPAERAMPVHRRSLEAHAAMPAEEAPRQDQAFVPAGPPRAAPAPVPNYAAPAGRVPPPLYAAPPQYAPRPTYAPPPRFAEEQDDGCGRYRDACTGADVRDAEMQFRAAYAAAEDAGADPRALAEVRRRWARMRQVDWGRPDLLVTDYARLAGRLGWLADNSDGPE